MSLGRQIRALRYATALSELDQVHAVRLTGEESYEALDWLCPRDLFLRDGQVVQTLLLNENGSVFADVLVGCDDDDFLLLAEGPSCLELRRHLERHMPADLDATIEDLSPDFAIVSVDGPYAWELLAELLGYDIVGLPYLTLFHTEYGICLRAGKTGEFGYHILVPREHLDDFRSELLDVGGDFDLVEVTLEALDLCALENWFFNIRVEGRACRSPLELQLQWRLSRHKEYLGSAAIEAMRPATSARVTTIVCAERIDIGDCIMVDTHAIGAVINAAYSICREGFVGLALIDRGWAHSGIDRYSVSHGERRCPIRTVSPPLINNRSLYVNPQKHCYRQRAEFGFPPIV